MYRPRKRTPKTAYPKATGAMRSTTCCTCPLPKPSATTTTSTATVPPPSCPTADKSTICITAADTCTKSASTKKSSPTSNAISCTAKSSAHRVNSPAVRTRSPVRLKNEEVLGGLEEETHFVWNGIHLLQEIHSDGRYTYIYTDPSNYEPLAQVRDWTTEDGEGVQQAHYFYCDKIDILRELNDKDGNLVRGTNSQSINCFDYNGNGQIIDQHHGKIRRAK